MFRVEDAEVSDDGVQIAGLDRSARVIDARFEEPYQVAAGTNTEAAIAAVLGEALPGVLTVFPGTSYTPLLFGEEAGDRWQFAQDLALSIGMTLYFNGDGAAVLSPALPQGRPPSSSRATVGFCSRRAATGSAPERSTA